MGETRFSEEYQFESTDDIELLNMVQTNISACLLNLKALLPNLRLAKNSKIILIGSTWGLDNHNGKEVTFLLPNMPSGNSSIVKRNITGR